ncbi:hypothetical protein SO694_00026158 [Aureococcus anophagefferens]|uniref:FCP1 homology domain-containing protein n=1 Tax=Aureococcus anophagefferens TaxID=44056 RepID=A0ABR1FUB7_AURAN
MAEPERGICVFDLDHTLLHMLKEEDMPAEVGDVTEDVVGFSYQGVDYSIALRVGTTSLVVEAIADRCDVFKDIPVHVIESRDKGGKSLKDLGLSRPRVVIFDDSINAWVAEDQEFVFTADRFDVNAMASAIQADDDAGDEAVDRELGYLTNIREAVMGFFAPPTIDWNEGLDSEPGTPREPRPERSSSFSKEFHGSPAASASSARLSEAPGADGDALSDTNRPLKDRSLKRPAGDEPPPSPDLSKKPRTTTDADATTARLDLPSLVPPSELANAAVAVQQEQVSAS